MLFCLIKLCFILILFILFLSYSTSFIFKIGDGAFKCSLYLSSKVLADTPMFYSSHSVMPSTCVYRRPTHTDLYLQWDSHYNLAFKFSVINTLTHRAKAVCSNCELLKTELKHLKRSSLSASI